MKNIAVIVYEFDNEYICSVVEGIEAYFEEKDDVRYILSAVRVPEGRNPTLDSHYWSLMNILKSDFIDGIVVVTNSFLGVVDVKALTGWLEVVAGKPVFSVAVPLSIEGSFYTHTLCSEAYCKIVKHLVEVHGKKHIGFVSSELNGSPEGAERLEAYKAALVVNGLEYNPEYVIPGDFTPGTALKSFEAFYARYGSKEAFPLDAVLCVNDMTVGGCILALKKLGLRCPDDVALVGFDDSDFALQTFPSISSINQTVPETGRKVAELAYRHITGQKTPRSVTIQCEPVYRQSCGCVETTTDSSAYVDSSGVYHSYTERYQKQNFQLVMSKSAILQDFNLMLDYLNSRITMDNFFETMEKAMKVAQINSAFICFYDSPVHLKENMQFPPQDKVKLKFHLNIKNRRRVMDEDGIIFNPTESIVPKEYLDQETAGGKYFLFPVYQHKENFGYVFCQIDYKENKVNFINLKLFMNVIVNAYEAIKEQNQRKALAARNMNLDRQRITDELTQLLNRRGFFEHGKMIMDSCLSPDNRGMVFFCDLDGLKKINDTYGHETGDLAIKTEAKVLKAVFRESDLIGRLSGDEFAVIATGLPAAKVQEIRNRVDQTNGKLSEEAGLPCRLSISMGAVEYNLEKHDLNALLAEADSCLYEEKRIKHSK